MYFILMVRNRTVCEVKDADEPAKNHRTLQFITSLRGMILLIVSNFLPVNTTRNNTIFSSSRQLLSAFIHQLCTSERRK